MAGILFIGWAAMFGCTGLLVGGGLAAAAYGINEIGTDAAQIGAEIFISVVIVIGIIFCIVACVKLDGPTAADMDMKLLTYAPLAFCISIGALIVFLSMRWTVWS